MGSRKQSTQICGHRSTETARTSKGQSGAIRRGKDERGCSRKEDIWSATKNVDGKTKKNKQKAPGNGDGGSTSETPQPPWKKRTQVDPTVENEETLMNRGKVKVKIPEELKPWHVDGWDLITRQKQLFYLSAKKDVDSILEDHANYKKSRGNTDNKEYAVNEVVAGIKEHFSVMLGTQVLYKSERPQCTEILLTNHPDALMSQVYHIY
ncbi:Mortality factor 4-like protein 1 [Heterocephalus glaber]|uniref:Mortality factor 4-like protein 1 n=1 Tax=Heterocephalus glaber TaxID=10181 RepID=G5BYR7_HETGA|nr:Mortality factor 4-like protein 1 [Heterocephalus glaber]